MSNKWDNKVWSGSNHNMVTAYGSVPLPDDYEDPFLKPSDLSPAVAAGDVARLLNGMTPEMQRRVLEAAKALMGL